MDDILDKLLTVARYAVTKSATGVGKPAATPTTRVADVPCTFWPATAQTRDEFARRDQVAEFEFCTARNIEATSEDVIVCEGRTYAVLGYKSFDNSAFGEPVNITVCSRRNQTTTPA